MCPPMDRESYESLLNELNNPELEHSRRAEVLQELRSDYSQVHHDFNEKEEKLNHYQKDNEDLVKANSKLFRNLGYNEEGGNDPVQQRDEKQQFSESITISDIEKNYKQKY